MLLILLGVGLGNLARIILGAPETDQQFPRKFSRPLTNPARETIKNTDASSADRQSPEQTGYLIPPILLPDSLREYASVHSGPFDHDELALFEPHGEQMCASGCALSRHPTNKLSEHLFFELIDKLNAEGDQSDQVIDELLYYGNQSVRLLDQHPGIIDPAQDQFLRQQLARTHARVAIRIVEDSGAIRSWLPETRVPLDRRHVFEMQASDLQPLVTSGTLKRVGRDYLWVRL